MGSTTRAIDESAARAPLNQHAYDFFGISAGGSRAGYRMDGNERQGRKAVEGRRRRGAASYGYVPGGNHDSSI